MEKLGVEVGKQRVLLGTEELKVRIRSRHFVKQQIFGD